MNFQIGPRMIKTGIAVLLTLLLTEYLDTQLRIVAVIASVLAMQPSIVRSWNYLKEVVIGNGLAILFAVSGIYVIGDSAVAIGIIVVLSIAINLKLNLNKTLNLTVLAILSIMLSSDQEVNFLYVLERVELLVIGILSAFVVNIFVFPPKHNEIIYKNIKKIGEKTNFLMKILPEKAYELKDTKKQIREIEKDITGIKEYYQILYEERNRLFVRDRGSFVRQIIIYKQMIRVLEKDLELIRNMSNNLKKIEQISEKQIYLAKKMIQEITRYQETLQLMFENKIVIKRDLDTESKKMMKLAINDLIKELKESEEENWYYIFPVASGIVDLIFEMEKLERLIGKRRKYEKKESLFNKIKKKINI